MISTCNILAEFDIWLCSLFVVFIIPQIFVDGIPLSCQQTALESEAHRLVQQHGGKIVRFAWVTSIKPKSFGQFRGAGRLSINSLVVANRLLEAGKADSETNRPSGKLTLGGKPIKVWPLSKAEERQQKINPGKRERLSAVKFNVTR